MQNRALKRIFGTFNINAELSEKNQSKKHFKSFAERCLFLRLFHQALFLKNNYNAVTQKLNNYYESICNEKQRKTRD